MRIGESSTSVAPGGPGGRPRQSSFEESSRRTKRRMASDISETSSVDELALATRISLTSAGKLDAAEIVKDITTKSPVRAAKYRAAYRMSMEPLRTEMSGDEALVDFIDAKLTKQQYKDIRKSLRQKKYIVYPSYEKVAAAKKLCYPSDIKVNETSAEVKLQSLLNHTCSRILKLQADVITSLKPEVTVNLRLLCKWGCDGSSGHSEYKQGFTNEDSSDASIFLTSIVPLQIVGSDNEHKEIVIWKNPRPSSPRYCRPIRVQFLKETVVSTNLERQHVENQIESLVPLTTITDAKDVVVKYELFFTMIDGKVCNSVTDTKSSMRCYICNHTSSKFNDIELMKTVALNTTRLDLGLSTLHAWIRFFECFLHIGYKIGVHKWQTRKEEEKKVIAERKRKIQAAFKKELHLIVDQPKQGFGSSNDGNTARRFFENTTLSANILGVDENIMKRCYVILQVLSSGYAVNVTAFQQYCIQTAAIFITLYSWYCMPTTVHKVLIHGPLIVQWSPLPIGQMSEDAQEARNKDIKKYRECYSRKNSRTATMEDVFNRLLLTSDPYMSSMGKRYPKKGKSLVPEALQLLLGTDSSRDKFGLAETSQYSTDESESANSSSDDD